VQSTFLILLYIQQDATLPSLFYLESALHVSEGATTHHQEFKCIVGGVRHPQHTQTSSNTSTIAADGSNGVTNTRCCNTVVCAPNDGR
jgi:hypothetical protein